MSYAINPTGTGWRAINSPDDLLPGETYSADQPVLAPTQAQVIATLEAAVQTYMDAQAQGAGYDSLLSAVSYAGSAKFGAQAGAFIAWRDACWSYCYGVEAAVQAGTQAVPTAAALVAGLPPITIPAVTL